MDSHVRMVIELAVNHSELGFPYDYGFQAGFKNDRALAMRCE